MTPPSRGPPSPTHVLVPTMALPSTTALPSPPGGTRGVGPPHSPVPPGRGMGLSPGSPSPGATCPRCADAAAGCSGACTGHAGALGARPVSHGIYPLIPPPWARLSFGGSRVLFKGGRPPPWLALAASPPSSHCPAPAGMCTGLGEHCSRTPSAPAPPYLPPPAPPRPGQPWNQWGKRPQRCPG